MNKPIAQFRQGIGKLTLLACLLYITTTLADASGLDTALTDREQALLNSAEQRHQAETLITMMQTLGKLTDYPEAAIDELTGDSANHQSLKRAIRALKQAKQQKEQDLRERTMLASQQATQQNARNCNCSKVSSRQTERSATATQNASPHKAKPTTELLTPVFAISKNSSGSTRGKVIFQPKGADSIEVYEGQSFDYAGESYSLLSVQSLESAGHSGKFNIHLKTPSALKRYQWPR